jgi:hypothetical protein
MVRLREEDGTSCLDEFIPAAERYNVMSMVTAGRPRHRTAGELRAPGQARATAGRKSLRYLDQRRGFPRVRSTRINNENVARALCFEITETAAVSSARQSNLFHARAQGAAAASHWMISAAACPRSCT